MKSLYLTRLLALAAVAFACLVGPGDAALRSEAKPPSGPPAGLTDYGRDIWELDALLHDTFGRRVTYLQFDLQTDVGNFTSTVPSVAHGYVYKYIFADASNSAFRLTMPIRRPPPLIGAAGASYPLTVRGAYVSCGRGLWLYEVGVGGGNVNTFADCVTSTGKSSPSFGPNHPSAFPAGLTSYGQYVWDLDALLHHTFGDGIVYFRAGGNRSSSNFTSSFVDMASGGIYTYTFAEPARSTFTLMRPPRQPPPRLGPDGARSFPLTVEGADISCGHGRWIYEDELGTYADEFIACWSGTHSS